MLLSASVTLIVKLKGDFPQPSDVGLTDGSVSSGTVPKKNKLLFVSVPLLWSVLFDLVVILYKPSGNVESVAMVHVPVISATHVNLLPPFCIVKLIVEDVVAEELQSSVAVALNVIVEPRVKLTVPLGDVRVLFKLPNSLKGIIVVTLFG